MIIIEFIKALILGIVEGLTEFAPVSSTGHMILVDDMWLKSSQFLGSHSAFTFKIVIQLGSVFAAAWVFRERYFEILGVLFDDFIEAHLFSVPTVMIGLFIGAIYMIIADKYSTKVKHPQTVDQINYLQAFVIGISQAVAMWPGFSRSGSTISTGVLMKLNHKSASDFTFIMAVPIMLAASALSYI